MALTDGFLYHIVARLGLERDVPALVMGEFGFDTDTQTLRVGNDTASPVKVLTTGSTGTFDFSKATKVTLPGGLVFEATKLNSVSGLPITDLNKSNGFLVRRGDGAFGSATLRSSDKSLLVEGGDGAQSTVNLRINPDSDIIQRLFNGIGVLNINSINGLQDFLDTLAAAIVTAREAAISTVRGGVDTDHNTLKKLYDFVNQNVIVVGDPTGVVAQVLQIIRDGVGDSRNTLKKISVVIDGLDSRVTALENQLASIGLGANYYDTYWYALIKDQTANTKIMLDMIDRSNQEKNYHG